MTVCAHSRRVASGIGLIVWTAVVLLLVAPASAGRVFEEFPKSKLLGCWVHTPSFDQDHIPAGESGWAEWTVCFRPNGTYVWHADACSPYAPAGGKLLCEGWNVAELTYQWDEENLKIAGYDKKGSTQTMLCRPVLSDSGLLKLTKCSMPDIEWTRQSFNDTP